MPLQERKPPTPCTKKRGFAHHWKIEPPSGPTVMARCPYCRRKREYQSYAAPMSYGIGILYDPLPARTHIGQFTVTGYQAP